MAKKETVRQLASRRISAQPHLQGKTSESQAYGTVLHLLPLDLEEPVRLEIAQQLNQLLADTMTLRDLYKKSHWQTANLLSAPPPL
jgi:starvation-inducible DNA-binding protein